MSGFSAVSTLQGLCRLGGDCRDGRWAGHSALAHASLPAPDQWQVERFNKTLLDEWAYARLYRSNDERRRAFSRWLRFYIANVGPPRSEALGVGWVGRLFVGGDAHDDLVLSGLLDGVGGRVGSDAQHTPSAREPGQEDREGVGDLRRVVDEHLGGPMQLASGQA